MWDLLLREFPEKVNFKLGDYFVKSGSFKKGLDTDYRVLRLCKRFAARQKHTASCGLFASLRDNQTSAQP